MAKEAFKTIHGNIFETPQWLFDSLSDEFNFTHDLACNAGNAKCEKHFTEADDSLKQDWHKLNGWLWLNPPYSPLKPWIKKTQIENSLGAKVVVLCPPVISTRYFSEWLPSEIRFIVGRIPFIKDGAEMKSNTNDSCLLIYDTKVRQPKITYVERDKFKKDEE
jgi:site-specific DNA-methyltransferase (adenine-specific)